MHYTATFRKRLSPKDGFCGTLWDICPRLLLMSLCHRWWTSCRTLSISSPHSRLILSRLSKCPRSCLSMSLCARPVPTTVSYSSLLWTVEQHVDIPVPGGGGSSSGLQGLLPRQRSTESPSRKRTSERIVEQIVDPVSRGSLPGSLPGQGSSSSHSPAGVEERADEPGEGVFRTFPQNKKVRRSLRIRGWNCLRTPAHPRRRLSWRTPSSGCGSRMTNLASRTTGTDALSVLSGSHRLASRWCGTPPRMRRGPATSGTRKRGSPRMTSLLCLLSEELHRQPRAVYKYWEGGLPSCDHAATCSSSSSSFTADMNQKDRCGCVCTRRVLLVTLHLALCSLPWLAGPECSAFWLVRT